MNEEQLCVVDELDRIIESRGRTAVHELHLLHRSVHILIQNKAGEIFLQRRSLSKTVNPGLWDTSAAGHVDFGEAYEEAAVREVEEELGIKAHNSLLYLTKISASASTGWEFIKVYQLIHNGPFQLDHREIMDGRWLYPEELNTWISSGGEGLTETFMLIWRTLKNQPSAV